MDKITISLTAAERRALLAFLKRTSLRPPEISTFAALFNLIDKAQPSSSPSFNHQSEIINHQL
jgi:hypothetical protein